MEQRTEQIFSDLGALCVPAAHISNTRDLTKWNAVPYETNDMTGSMLVSMSKGHPETVTLPLNLTGWYRIYVALGTYSHWMEQPNYVALKLTDDQAVMHLSLSPSQTPTYHSMEEAFWRCADLTGQSIEISKHPDTPSAISMLGWIRVVPMSEEEVAAHLADQARTDTKRIYATNDMHGMFCMYGLDEKEQWRTVVQEFADSDVEWFSMENITFFDGDISNGNVETFDYSSDTDYMVQTKLKPYFTMDMLSHVTQYGHSRGLKICESIRMGAWGLEFPDDQTYFANVFAVEHPELRCIDRDGLPIDALSYIYPEVQDYMLDQFTNMAKTGCDAVEMICNRGVPYVLFEPPFVEMFQARYGEDPRYLPLDDARVTELRCEVMTNFVRRLRARLDEVCPDRKIGLHARVLFSLWDSRHIGLDPETWAKEGLITAVLSYPQRIREILDGDVWQENCPDHLDLEKYTKYAREREDNLIYRKQDFNFMPPMADSHGVLRGPATQQERVDEFMRLEKEYGVPVYLEIMPRHMTTEEYKNRALELYNCGCNHISLWDTYSRVRGKAEWSMLRRMGHKDELPGFDSGEGTLYRQVRLLKVGGKDVGRYKPAWGG